jgi:amino acid transporter
LIVAVKSIAIEQEVAELVPTLSLKDAVAMIVGIVVGAGIFRTPSLVAANVSSETNALLLWLAGGAISLIGAFCYAELTATYPHTGGDYHYLSRAYGRPLSFLFVWSRVTVIQTGSVALLSFVFGDYASQLLRLGEYSPSIYAAVLVVVLTGLNVLGVHQGTRTQNYLTVIEVFSLLLVIIAGLFLIDSPPAAPQPAPVQSSVGSIGLAMVFVLLTYGGWNEAAYISAETTNRRDVARALLLSIAIVTGLYLLVNWAYLRGLGLSGVASSEAVATDLMKRAVGDRGALFVTLLVAISAITSVYGCTHKLRVRPRLSVVWILGAMAKARQHANQRFVSSRRTRSGFGINRNSDARGFCYYGRVYGASLLVFLFHGWALFDGAANQRTRRRSAVSYTAVPAAAAGILYQLPLHVAGKRCLRVRDISQAG